MVGDLDEDDARGVHGNCSPRLRVNERVGFGEAAIHIGGDDLRRRGFEHLDFCTDGAFTRLRLALV
jgi:hypothetical protein